MVGWITDTPKQKLAGKLAEVRNEARVWENRLAYVSKPETSLADVERIGRQMANDIAQNIGPRTEAGPGITHLNVAVAYLELIRETYRAKSA